MMELSAHHAAVLKTAVQTGDLKVVRKILRQTVSKKVEEIVVREAIQFQQWDVIDFLHHRTNTHIYLMEYALEMAVRAQNEDAVKKILPICNPLHNNSEALYCAVQINCPILVKMLLPHSDANAGNCRALCAAVRADNRGLVNVLIAHCDPTLGESAALKETVVYNNQELFDLLCPVSNLNDVWEYIRADNWFDKNQRKMVTQRLNQERQRKRLQKAAATVNVSLPRRSSKI